MKRFALMAVGVAFAAQAALGQSGSAAMPARGGVAHEAVQARWAMEETIPDLNLDGVSVSRVMDFLRSVSGANLVVDWNTLEAAGVSKSSPITLQVRGLTLRTALGLVLDQASPNTALTVTVDHNVIQITTEEAADRKLVTRIYSVEDLLIPPINSVAPKLGISQVSQQGTTSGGGGGSGLFTDNGANAQQNETPQQRGDSMVALIQKMVRPTIWQANGGPASISFFGGHLIVTAPLSVQETIGGSPESSGERFGF